MMPLILSPHAEALVGEAANSPLAKEVGSSRSSDTCRQSSPESDKHYDRDQSAEGVKPTPKLSGG